MFSTEVDPCFEIIYHSKQLPERLRKKVRANLERGYMKTQNGEAGETTRFFWSLASGMQKWDMPFVGITRARARVPHWLSEDTFRQIEVLKRINPPAKTGNVNVISGYRNPYGGKDDYAGAECIIRAMVNDPKFVEIRQKAVEEFDKRRSYRKAAGGNWEAM